MLGSGRTHYGKTWLRLRRKPRHPFAANHGTRSCVLLQTTAPVRRKPRHPFMRPPATTAPVHASSCKPRHPFAANHGTRSPETTAPVHASSCNHATGRVLQFARPLRKGLQRPRGPDHHRARHALGRRRQEAGEVGWCGTAFPGCGGPHDVNSRPRPGSRRAPAEPSNFRVSHQFRPQNWVLQSLYLHGVSGVNWVGIAPFWRSRWIALPIILVSVRDTNGCLLCAQCETPYLPPEVRKGGI